MDTPPSTRRNRLAQLALWLCAACAWLPAKPLPGSAATTATIRIPADDTPLVRLSGNTSAHAKPRFDRGRVRDNFPMEHILLLLRRDGAREQQLESFMGRQYDPHSPDFHHWLTPQEFGARFGPPSADIQKVTAWLTQRGFRINNVPASGLFVDFSGSARQLAQAFHTEIHQYRVPGQNRDAHSRSAEDHYANMGDPYVPAALAPLVSGFRALDNFHPRAHVRSLGTAHLDRVSKKWSRAGADRGHLTASTNPFYIAGPQDFATIYGVKQVWQEGVGGATSAPLIVGTGQTIGVVGESDIASADIQTFRDQFGVTALGPNGSVQMENPPANVCAAPDPADNEPESYLDAEWSGAMAPDATVDFVACGRQSVTSGADLAAAYILGDAAHVQRISVLSTSYGDCEALPQSEANQFYVSLWQQAAAEGITVVVAAGDTGGDGCQDLNTYATDGLSVVNEASTAYNVAAGGTDFSDVFSGTASTYWSATNGANFLSAHSYIPETPWNESCGSPLVLERFGQGLTSSGGPSGFCTYASQQPVDPLTDYSPYFLPYAGSGGLSVVSARPPWQSGVTGLPAQGGRAVPDISMFASGGDTWGQALILCDSGLANMPPGTACDFTNADDLFANYGGGTSFVAPAFAGIMALINQKSGDRQGQANYVLYPLAAQQYVSFGSPSQPSLANCAAYLGPQSLSGCYFHDVSSTPNTVATPPFVGATTQIPCTGTATAPGTFTDGSMDPASDNKNCYGYQITVTENGGSLTTTPDYYGVLAAADNSAAWSATPGYDLATGLGSPNVYSLVNAPQWSGGLKTSVALTLNNTNITAAEMVTLTATVDDQDGVPAVGGTVTFYSGNVALGTVTQACSPGGGFSLPVLGSAFGAVARYGNVFASFAGGTQSCQAKSAVYYGAQSTPVTVTISPERLGKNATPLTPSVPHPPGVSR